MASSSDFKQLKQTRTKSEETTRSASNETVNDDNRSTTTEEIIPIKVKYIHFLIKNLFVFYRKLQMLLPSLTLDSKA